MSKKMTTQEFIEKARAIHGDKYDYSKVNYVDRTTKVCIICPEHGEFWQIPKDHLAGHGCSECGGSNPIDKNQFEIRLKERGWDYIEIIDFNGFGKESKFYCKKHKQEFNAVPIYMISQASPSCEECKKEHRLEQNENMRIWTEESFIVFCSKMPEHENLEYIHDGTFKGFSFKGEKAQIHCKCKLCGYDFKQNAANHKNGSSCPKCAQHQRGKKYDVNDVIELLKNANSDYILYTDSYKSYGEKAKFHCNKCNSDFEAIPSALIAKGNTCQCNCHPHKTYHEHVEEIEKDYPWTITEKDGKCCDKVHGHCNLHGLNFDISITGFIQKKNGGCPKCLSKQTYKYKDVNAIHFALNEKFKGDIVLIDNTYVSHKEQAQFKCLKCGFTFSSTLGRLFNSRTKVGCPHCGKGFVKSYVLSLIDKMDLLNMDEQDLFEIISMKGLPTKFNALLNSNAGSKERENSINELKKSIENETEEEFEKEIEQNESEDKRSEEAENKSDSDKTAFEISVNGQEDEDTTTSLDFILSAISGIDKANIFVGESEKFLVTKNINRIWNLALKADENGKLEDFISDFKSRTSSGKWFDHIRDGFFSEYNTVISITKDEDCCFAKNGKPCNPNLMQQLMVFKGMTHVNYGNWCGTGTGKSFARDLLSRAIDSRISVYIVPNGTVLQTIEELTKKHYHNPAKCVLHPERPSDIHSMDTNKHNYIVLNYDKFNQANTFEWIDTILSKNPKIDFVCLDEVQNVKVRNDKNASSRYQNVLAFVTRIRKMNKDVKVLAMSATPIVINLTEVIMLLNLLTGYDYSNEIGKQMTYSNVHNAYKALVLNGFRYLKSYKEIEQNPIEFVETDGSDLFDELVKVDNKQGVLPIEKILLPRKLEAIQDRICEGTILYIEYVDHGHFIPTIREFLDKQNITSITYIGSNDKETRKENLEQFLKGKAQVLILSSTGSTGLDGLQKKGHQIIPLSLPWTSAEMEQLKGRIVRTGYEAGKPVNIIIPQVVVTKPNSEKWSWDKRRWSKIENRQTRGEMVMDGNFKSVKEYDEKMVRSVLLDNAIKALKEGLVDMEVTREPITSDKITVVERTRESTVSEINETHRKANTCKHEHIRENAFGNSQTKFREYHRKRREAIKNNWISDPLDKIAEIINKYKPSRYEKIIDLGCGENLLKTKVQDGENRMVSVDFFNTNDDDTVIQGDCTNLKGIIKDESVQIAVHCLSLWGNPFIDYFKEDWRILESGMDALLFVVEPIEHFGENTRLGTVESFTETIENVGFQKKGQVENIDGKFYLFQFTK